MPLALAAGLFIAAPLTAQDVVHSQLENRAASMAGSDYVAVGEPQTGYVNAGDEDRFTVTLQAGIPYKLIGVCDQDCTDVDLVLEDAGGNQLDSDVLLDDIPVVDYTPSSTGNYTVRVAMVTCSIEPCGWGVQLYRSRNATVSAAAAGPAEHHAGQLASGDAQLPNGEYYDTYVINVQAGQTITADLRSTAFDTYLILRSPSGDQTDNDDFEGTSHSRIEHVADEAGQWQVLATSYEGGETGAYTLDIAVSSGGAAAGPAEVRNESGALQKGDETLDSGEYVDHFTFDGSQGQHVVLDLRSSDFDPYLILLTPGGDTEQNDDFEGDASRSVIALDLPEDGEYIVGVTSYAVGETGSYTLRIEKTGAAGKGLRKESGHLENGDETLRSGEYMDAYTFQGVPGQDVSVDLTSDDFDTYLIVRGPGEDREENDDTDRPGHSAIDMTLSESGEYRVIVTSYQVGETGAYELTIDQGGGEGQVVAARNDVVVIAPGQSMDGSLAPGDGQLDNDEYRDIYVFDGTAGQNVSIEMRSTDFDTYLGLIAPSGEDIQNDDYEGSTSVSRIDNTLTESGRYRIVATSYGGEETGAYNLLLRTGTAAPAVAQAGASRPPSGNGDVYGVFVGISDYPGEQNDLAYTADDARRVAAALADGAGMRQNDFVVLTDAQATRANVERAVREVGGRAGPNDIFVLFYSGHGNRVERQGFQASDPDGMDETLVFYDEQISDDDMDTLLSSISPGTELLLFDACFSGGFSKDVINRPGRMGLFSSEEDVTSSVAAKFRAGGYLAQFLADGIGDHLADTDGDGALTAIEVSQYLHERYRADVKSAGPGDFVRTGGPQLGYQHLVVDRGSVGPNDVLFR